MSAPAPPSELGSTRHRLRSPALVAVGLTAAAGITAAVDFRVHHVPLCPLRSLTGLDCPFCGGLRSVASLTRGRVEEALSYNVLVTVGIPVAIVVWLVWIWNRTRGTDLPVPTWLQPAGTALLIGFMVIRNLPAFDWLNSGG